MNVEGVVDGGVAAGREGGWDSFERLARFLVSTAVHSSVELLETVGTDSRIRLVAEPWHAQTRLIAAQIAAHQIADTLAAD